MDIKISVEDIEGAWSGETPTGLIQRCKACWNTPLTELSDLMVTTFLNQKIALNHMILEAERRLKECKRDNSELYEGQLHESFKKAQST